MFPLKLALRYMRKPAPIIIALLIAASAVVYLVLLAITEGQREYWMHQLLGLRSHVTLTVKNMPQGIRKYPALVSELEKIDSVAVATPFREDTCFAFTSGMRTICPVRSIRLEDLLRYGTIRANVQSDHFEVKHFEKDGRDYPMPGCIIGEEFSKSMGLVPNDQITLMTDVNPGGTITPNFKQFYVQEIRHDVADIFDRDIWIDFETGRELMGKDNGYIRGVAIFLKDNDPDSPKLEPVRDQALEVFRKHIATDPVYDVPVGSWTRDQYLQRASAETWKEIDRKWYMQAVFNSQISRIAVFIFIALVALFMFFFMSVLVRDKKRDIGILMATGTTPWQIAQTFLWLAAMVTTVALLAGLPLGALIVSQINPIMEWFADHGMPIITKEMLSMRSIPVSSHMGGEYIAVLVFSYAVMMLASAWPSISAARTDPVRTLHYE
ncbi:MAG TPA: FtsX-like permease family protein [Planctomycetota bacterium]|nr:FtsX-like permease family protein [Planctomycetota bacterium]